MVNMYDLLKNTYEGKKVFITGHTGFKGSWLLKILNILGAEVKGYALNTKTNNDLFNLIEGNSLCQSIISDIRDFASLNAAIHDFQPDYIFHLAAQPLVRLSYEIPGETFEVNAMGTVTLLECIRKLKNTCNVVIITTDKVYHNLESNTPYKENDKLGGYDPYSASKACAELIIECYENSFFNIKEYDKHKKRIAVARAGNVIGGGDWSKDRLVPDIIESLCSNTDITIRNPNSIRPWQHVLEPLTGYLILGSKLNTGATIMSEAFNFGPYPNDALSVIDFVELAIDSWGKGKYKIAEKTNEPHEAGIIQLDINKAIEKLDWRPKYSAATSLDITLGWYKEFFNNRNGINDFTKKQILDYLNA